MIIVADGVRFKTITPGMVRMLDTLTTLDTTKRASCPGMPQTLQITSASEGKLGDGVHSTNPPSRHYTGDGLDVQSNTFPNQASKDLFRMNWQALLGPRFWVGEETSATPGATGPHFHAQVAKGTVYP